MLHQEVAVRPWRVSTTKPSVSKVAIPNGRFTKKNMPRVVLHDEAAHVRAEGGAEHDAHTAHRV